ncbi:unnamed protein product [Mortierella alpina]
MLQGAQDSTTVVESDAENSWASHKDLMTVDEDVSGHESSAARLRAVESVLIMLIESPCIKGDVDVGWVRKCAFKSDRFSEEKCRTVAYLANILRQFSPKKIENEDGSFTEAAPHVTSYAALVNGRNRISSILPATPGHFDVNDIDNNLLSDCKDITTYPKNKRAVFGAFFDLEKIDNICSKHGLTFANRLGFCDKFTIHLTGEQIKHGGAKGSGARAGYPSSSQYDKRNASTKHQSSSGIWAKKFLETGLTKEGIGELASSIGKEHYKQECAVKPLRDEVDARLKRQDEASLRVKRKEAGAYTDLIEARRSLRAIRSTFHLEDEKLKALRQQSYQINKMSKAAEGALRSKARSGQASAASSTPSLSTPTWERSAIEDSTKYLDLSQLKASSNKTGYLLTAGQTVVS